MTEYRMKPGKIGEKVVKTAKKVEDAFVDTFLEEDENNPSGYSMKTGKMAERATSAYKKIENTVVGAYKKVEDAFVDTFLEKAGDEDTVSAKEQADGESDKCVEDSAE